MKIQFTLHDTSNRGEILEHYYKRPVFFRQGIERSDSFTSTDGKKVWTVSKGVWKEIEGKPYKRMASLEDFFIGYRESRVVYDFIGVEVLNHAPVYHLKRTFCPLSPRNSWYYTAFFDFFPYCFDNFNLNGVIKYFDNPI